MATGNDVVEEGLQFNPRFDGSGLITAVAQDAKTGQVIGEVPMEVEPDQHWTPKPFGEINGGWRVSSEPNTEASDQPHITRKQT